MTKPMLLYHFKNVSWGVLERAIRLVAGFLVGVWVANYLGVEKFGVLSYVMSISSLFTVLTTVGLDSVVVKALVNKSYNPAQVLSTVFYIKLAGAVLSLLIFLIVFLFFLNEESYKFVFVILASYTFHCFNVFDLYFQSQEKMKFVSLSSLFALLCASAVKVVFILNAFSLNTFFYVFVLESAVLSFFLLYFFYKNGMKGVFRSFSLDLAVDFVKQGAPLFLSGIFIILYMRIDQIMLKHMLGVDSVGIYTAATRISESVYSFSVVAASALFPFVLKAKLQSEGLYQKRMQMLNDLFCWVAISIALLITFFGEQIIDFLFSSDFSESASVLIVHVWAGVFVFLGVLSGKWLMAEGLQKYSFYRTVLGLVANVVLNLLLIPKYGVVGAAYSIVAAQALASCFFYLCFRNLRPVFIFQSKALFWPFRYFYNEVKRC